MTSLYRDLFDPRPEQWGLRGDPYLWDDLIEHIGNLELPNSASEVKASLESAIVSLTGTEFDGDDAYFVERYNHGGMSGGHISRHFWAATAIPLLVSRFRGRAPKTRDYFAELYVAGVFGDQGWAVYFPKRDVGFDFMISKEVNGEVIIRPVQVKGRYPTAEKKDQPAYGFSGTLSAVHPEMVLAIPFFSAEGRSSAPSCIAYMPLTQIRGTESRGVRCVPCRFVSGVPQPRQSFAKYFDHAGILALEARSWSTAAPMPANEIENL